MTPTELAELRAECEAVDAKYADYERYVDWSGGKIGMRPLEVRLARAFLTAPPPLAWTDARPAVEGWYWYRRDSNSMPFTTRFDPVTPVYKSGQFAGPIPQPGLEAKERG